MLNAIKADMSHQEIERILSEVEAWWTTTFESTGVEWLPMLGITNFLFMDLGYEDIDEFEDAIHGSFPDFLASFPHIEVKEIDEKFFLKVHPPQPGPPRMLAITITSSAQLLDTVCMKAEDAEIEIPKLGFAIGADSKRHIDSFYNHIIAAREDLDRHAAALGSNPDEQTKIQATLQGLQELLDVSEPVDIIVRDPSSRSEIKPNADVRILDFLPSWDSVDAAEGSGPAAPVPADAGPAPAPVLAPVDEAGPEKEEGADEDK